MKIPESYPSQCIPALYTTSLILRSRVNFVTHKVKMLTSYKLEDCFLLRKLRSQLPWVQFLYTLEASLKGVSINIKHCLAYLSCMAIKLTRNGEVTGNEYLHPKLTKKLRILNWSNMIKLCITCQVLDGQQGCKHLADHRASGIIWHMSKSYFLLSKLVS